MFNKQKEPTPTVMYSEEQLMARLKFFIGICLSLTLFGIVFVVLYSIIFVTQPLNAISPIDQKFFELIIPIATFLTGTLSGIMLAGSSKEDKEAMLEAQKLSMKNFEETKEAMLKPVMNAASSMGMAANVPTGNGKPFMSEMGVELEAGDPPERNTRND
jgi:hypothetical protein